VPDTSHHCPQAWGEPAPGWVKGGEQCCTNVTGAREQCRAYYIFAAHHLPEAKVTAADEPLSGLDDRFLDGLGQPSGLPIPANVVQLRERVDIISDRPRAIRTPNF
jgi:hypothetical protein